VERKIARLEKASKSGDKKILKGIDVLKKFVNHFENFQNARDLALSEDEKIWTEDMFLLTAKPVLYVCNVDDESAVEGNGYVRSVQDALKGSGAQIMIIAGKLEAEITELDDEDDRAEFLNDAGLTEPGVNKLIRGAYDLLHLQSFFTAGPKEVKAWTIRKGMTAPQAAGVIHSDLERGFIRAEVMKYPDFIKLGSESACKDAGRFFVEGKNYVVDDGDIMHIRFNV